jgi:nitrate reductase NapE component
MDMLRRLLISFMLLALSITPAWAATVTGSTGLIVVPEADILGPGGFEASLHIAHNAIMSLSLGIFDHVELSLYTPLRNGDLEYTAKVLLNAESATFPGVAIGVESGDVYIALSRSFGRMRGTLGFGNGGFRGIFGGISYQLNPVYFGKMQTAPKLLLDYNGHLLNGGIRIPLASRLELDASFIDFDHTMIGLTFKTQF